VLLLLLLLYHLRLAPRQVLLAAATGSLGRSCSGDLMPPLHQHQQMVGAILAYLLLLLLCLLLLYRWVVVRVQGQECLLVQVLHVVLSACSGQQQQHMQLWLYLDVQQQHHQLCCCCCTHLCNCPLLLLLLLLVFQCAASCLHTRP
jgi:hypothetical protein